MKLKKGAADAPRVLLVDIETAPLLAYIWQLYNNDNIGLNQIKSDWYILAFAAKWLGAPKREMVYRDQRSARNIEDDSKLLKVIWKLLDEADVIITQNGKRFDEKKLNARFILNGFKPPSSYKHIDTLAIARKRFGFTSNKLEYMSEKLNTTYKKQKHAKFGGMALWTECLNGNQAAWREMEKYNKYDVLALEELYNRLQPWDNQLQPSLYSDSLERICGCGSTKFQRYGFAYTTTGKFQRYLCAKCGTETRDATNLFDKEKIASLSRRVGK